jgi:hypothetical protein
VLVTIHQDLKTFKQLQAIMQTVSPGEIEDATGIFDLSAVWGERTKKLKNDLKNTTNEIEISAIKSRIETMLPNGIAGMFSVRMLYSMELNGSVLFDDPNGYLPGKPVGVGTKDAWTLELWCGAWDADAQSGYMVGYLGIPLSLSDEKNDGRVKTNNTGSHFKYLSDMINNPLKLRQ